MKKIVLHALVAFSACSRPGGPNAASAGPAPAAPAPAPPRANHEGRVLPPLPRIDRPVMFDTREADALVSALHIFPKDNPWNEDISGRPVHPDSQKIVEAVGADKRFRFNLDMGFILVPPGQPPVPLEITDYPDESDPGPYPIPDEAPIEGWPLGPDTAGKTLEQVQREGEGDRHVLVVDPVRNRLYELFRAFRTERGWRAASAAVFDMNSNRLRPKDWTSADAAGLPIFPAVVRYDECERGGVEHALRVTVRRTRKAYVYPATHQAGHGNNPYWPRMGERFRLRRDFDIRPYPPHVQAILKGLKKYGMIVADNGIEWAVSIAPDRRIQGLESLHERPLRGRDFEVIVPTGPNEGPRACSPR